MDKNIPKVTDYIFCFMEQLNVVEVRIGIPAQALERLPKLSKEQLDNEKQAVSYLIQYFGQCRYLMQKDPEKYYTWCKSHEYDGEENYIRVERKYCQMTFLVKMVFQKAGLQDEFKQAVAKANEDLKIWRKEQSV